MPYQHRYSGPVQYPEAVQWLGSRGRFRIKPGVHRTAELLRALGQPQQGMRGLLVVGTNGKGSTCSMMVAALSGAGYRVGSMPSPHLQDYVERVRIDGRPVGRDAFAALITEVRPVVERLDEQSVSATEFEIITAAAVSHFRASGVDLIVIEAGMGGRDDAVSVLDPGVKVITTVALDHQEFLGTTIAEIARNKAGVVRPGDDLVVGWLPPDAAAAVQETVDELTDVRAVWAARDIRIGVCGDELDVTTPLRAWRSLRCPMEGDHQRTNLALAVVAVELARRRFGLREITAADWNDALSTLRWAGRLETVSRALLPGGWTGTVVLDGAHNPHALSAVVPYLSRTLPADPVVVFAAMRDKALADLAAIVPDEWAVVATTVGEERSATPAELAEAFGRHHQVTLAPDVPSALAAAAEQAGDGPIAALGSLHLVGAVRDHLQLPPR